MQCERCGAAIAEGQRFCPSCGLELRQPAPIQTNPEVTQPGIKRQGPVMTQPGMKPEYAVKTEQPKKKSKKGLWIGLAAGAAVLIAAAVLLLVFRPWASGDEYSLPREAGMNQLTIYWKADRIDFGTSDIWIWYGNIEGRGYRLHRCAYGAKCVVNVPENVTEVGFLVRLHCSDPGGTSWGVAEKDVETDRYVWMNGDTTIYLISRDEGIYTSIDGGETLMRKR